MCLQIKVYLHSCTIVDRSVKFWHNFVKWYIDDAGRTKSPKGVSKTRAGGRVNCSRDSTIRGVHEAERLLWLGSLRTINPPRSQVAHVLDYRATRGETWVSSDLLPRQTTIRLLVIYCYRMLRYWPKVDRMDYNGTRDCCLSLFYFSLQVLVREINKINYNNSQTVLYNFRLCSQQFLQLVLLQQ